MLSRVVAAACFIGCVVSQIPGYPSYSLAATNTTLGVKYGKVEVTPGETLGYKVPSISPTISSPLPLNGSYIAILVDTTANLSSPIPADLLWFQQDVSFTSAGTATFNASVAQVPYLAPSSVGHAYIALLYTQPPGFIIPSNFPYSNTFRTAFNVTRVGADFHTPLLEANYFVLGSNCTGSGSATKSGGYPSGTVGYHGPSANHAAKGPGRKFSGFY